MRAIRITYKRGLRELTDTQTFEFPDHFSEDYIDGFQMAMEVSVAIESVERTE